VRRALQHQGLCRPLLWTQTPGECAGGPSEPRGLALTWKGKKKEKKRKKKRGRGNFVVGSVQLHTPCRTLSHTPTPTPTPPPTLTPTPAPNPPPDSHIPTTTTDSNAQRALSPNLTSHLQKPPAPSWTATVSAGGGILRGRAAPAPARAAHRTRATRRKLRCREAKLPLLWDTEG